MVIGATSALKEDGTPSDVANTSYDGNAMAQFPLCWIYRYEDDDYLYEIVSPAQYDENYKAFAHIDKDSNVKSWFYTGLFISSGDATKLRSLSGKSVAYNSYNVCAPAAKANGDNWSIIWFAWAVLLMIVLQLLNVW